MKEQIKNPYHHVILIAFVLGIIVCHALFHPERKDVIETTTETKIETTIEEVDTSFQEQATVSKPIKPKKTVAKNDLKEPEPEKYDSVRHYSGTYTFDHGKFDWEIETGGTLLGYSYKPTLFIPTTTKETTTTTNRISYIYPKGIYAGLSADSELVWGVNATYVQKDFLLGYSYRPGAVLQPLSVSQGIKPVHEVRAAVNIFNLFK